MNYWKQIIVSSICLLLTLSCNEPPPTLPKPRIYPKVVYPEKVYADFAESSCPFQMEVPTYFEVDKNIKKNEEEVDYTCWFDLYCAPLNGYLHFSYIPVESRKEFDKLVADAFEMVDKHNIKASSRQESLIENTEKDVYGLLFEIDGPVATPLQFFMTDSTRHFVRGSLYFKAGVNRDSIAPVYDFLKKDVAHLIEGFGWK